MPPRTVGHAIRAERFFPAPDRYARNAGAPLAGGSPAFRPLPCCTTAPICTTPGGVWPLVLQLRVPEDTPSGVPFRDIDGSPPTNHGAGLPRRPEAHVPAGIWTFPSAFANPSCTPVATEYHRCMTTAPAEEMSVRELRASLADVINAAGMHDQVTFVTSRGRRVAAVVSVAMAEAAEEDSQAADDAAMAQLYAVNVVMIEDRGGTPSLTVAEIYEQYAADLLQEFGGNPSRALAAARAVAASAADKVEYPMLWRQAALAVELCQRAVEMTGRILPGSYRPGSRASSVRGRRPKSRAAFDSAEA